MIRNVDLNEISDGKLYKSNDMVKTDCGGCQNCSSCCTGMGKSIILDPYDIYMLTKGLSQSFEELMTNSIELNVVDGIILPNLKMAGEKEICSFLNQEGRCSIHAIRPGICRLFPLGRFYENDSFQYFLQTKECPKSNKTKIKIKNWLAVPQLKSYEQFIADWHYFLKNLQEYAMENVGDENVKKISLLLLNKFYVTPYDTDTDFYIQFYQRMENWGK